MNTGPAPRSDAPDTPALHLIYGGTFDPVHLGHLAVARVALAQCGARRLDFMPAADPPHRDTPGAGFADRVGMLQAALATEPPPETGAWGLDPREGQRSGPSYTVETLLEWRVGHGDHAPLGFVMGADAFRSLHLWHAWKAMFSLAHLVVARRAGSTLDDLSAPLSAQCQGRWASSAEALRAQPAGRVLVLDLPLQPESATAVRRALAQGRPLQEGLPDAVAAYIARRSLYGSTPAAR